MHRSEKCSDARTWSVVAPFFNGGQNDKWIDDFVNHGRWYFRKIPFSFGPDDWHSRRRRATGARKWLKYWEQSRDAFPASGIITVFPQPAAMLGLQKTLRRAQTPIIAWCFNLGQYPRGLKRAAARRLLAAVDKFIVHSTGEIPLVAEFLDLPLNRVEYVPLQRAPIPLVASEDTKNPFIVAMGSANRDFETFFKAAEISRLPCRVVASPRSIEGLQIPANVTVETGLDPTACHIMVQRSRLSVVPLLDPTVASGQVTIIESMRMETPVIATRSIGTTDYIRDGKTGTLVEARDPEGLAMAMQALWSERQLRLAYASSASEFAAHSLSDEAAASALARIISELER